MAAKDNAKKGLSREQAAELYSDLRNAMAQMQSGAPKAKVKVATGGDPVAKQIAQEISKAMSKDSGRSSQGARARQFNPEPSFDSSSSNYVEPPRTRGAVVAVLLVLFFGVAKVSFSAFEAMGIFTPQSAVAAIASAPTSRFSPEEIRVLSALDTRRVELADRGKRLEQRESDVAEREREFTVRVAQLKELTDKLRGEREKNERKKSSQLEQLANVYGAMGPQEAAQLLEQLDVSIALSLVEKMPEKRIGQILSMMSKERALTLTKMLSGKGAA